MGVIDREVVGELVGRVGGLLVVPGKGGCRGLVVVLTGVMEGVDEGGVGTDDMVCEECVSE